MNFPDVSIAILKRKESLNCNFRQKNVRLVDQTFPAQEKEETGAFASNA